MNILNKMYRNEKIIINIFFIILFIMGFIFGIIYRFYGNERLIEMSNYLFFYSKNDTTNNYNIYLSITGGYIIISLLFATSFIGTLLSSFIIFSKGIHIALACISYFIINKFSLSMLFFTFIPQFVIELVLVYVISVISLKLSLNCFSICFLFPEVFNSQKIINYLLDYLIIILIIVTLSMAFKVYLL